MSLRNLNILGLRSAAKEGDPARFKHDLINILIDMDEDIEKIKKEIEEIKNKLLKNEKK